MLISHQSLVETLEVQDVEAFTDAVKAYDSISRLDPWYSTHPQITQVNDSPQNGTYGS